MENEITIPILPCKSINEVLTFYTALGFEITYQQEKPNVYGVVERGGICLHFFTMRDYDPAQSYSTCLVGVPDVDELYQSFAKGLRQHYGKLPTVGIPRVNRLRTRSDGGRGFNVIDPGGNWIRIFQTKQQSVDDTVAPDEASHLSRAVRAADEIVNSHVDYAHAAQMLDKALAKQADAPMTHHVKALVYRAELAVTLDDTQTAEKMLAQLRDIPLEDADRTVLQPELERANDLVQMLQSSGD